MKKAKTKAKRGNGWGVRLKSGKLYTYRRTGNRLAYGSKLHADIVADRFSGARAVRVQVEPVED